MSAASYLDEAGGPRREDESYLESQAQEIDEEISKLQARLRGFLSRSRDGLVAQASAYPPVQHNSDVQRHEHLLRNNQKNESYPGRSTSSDVDIENDSSGSKGASNDPPTLFNDADFEDKKIDEMPNGWVTCWTPEGFPYFVETTTEISTWTHPRQGDASLLFDAHFDLARAWKQYITLYKPKLNLSELEETPTIGELAIIWEAIRGHVKPGTWPNWWRENKLERYPTLPSPLLCQICRHINFDALFHTTNAWGDHQKIPLGSLRSIAKKTYCAFCRLVLRTTSRETSDVVLKLSENGMIMRCHLIKDMQWSRLSKKVRVIYIELQLSTGENSLGRLGPYRIHEILRGDERPAEQKHNDSRLTKDQVDIALIQQWIQHCEREHQSMQMDSNMINPSFAPPEPRGIHDQAILIKEPCKIVPLSNNSLELTLIDVKTRCLVDTAPSVRYIALSYVWGGPQLFQNTKAIRHDLYVPGALSTGKGKIPQTIRDAIILVQLLGEQYLWVDSLCIVQDDTNNKADQISNMGNIYSCALLTIVAAYGSSCHAGLPGIQAGSRKSNQHVEEVEDMLLANELSYLSDIIDDSIWNTRGWTYQEHELSKRCLFFTDDCVYFSCNQMGCKEDSGQRNISLPGEKHMRIRAERQPAWYSYRRAVTKITKRTFTLDGDIINAFEGIVSLLQPVFKCDFLYGLPITELDLALLWQPKSPIRRRVDTSTGQAMFPSWSWAGWVGEIDYSWMRHLLDDLSRVEWQVWNGADKEYVYVTSTQLRAPCSGMFDTWEYVATSDDRSRAGVPYYYQPDNPNIWCLHPTAAKEARTPYSLLRSGEQELKFKAQTAMLRVRIKPHIVSPFNQDSVSMCTNDHHVCCPIEVRSVDNFAAGVVYVPAHIIPTFANELHEFVCLSRRRGYPADTIGLNIYEKYQGRDSYPLPKNDIEDIPSRPTLYPGQRRIEMVEDKYDHSRFNKNKPWPLYNVMLIERKGDVAFRVAVGIVHMTAFLQARPVEKLIRLA